MLIGYVSDERYVAGFGHGADVRIASADDDAGVFAMQYLEFPVWKERLRHGHDDSRQYRSPHQKRGYRSSHAG